MTLRSIDESNDDIAPWRTQTDARGAFEIRGRGDWREPLLFVEARGHEPSPPMRFALGDAMLRVVVERSR